MKTLYMFVVRHPLNKERPMVTLVSASDLYSAEQEVIHSFGTAALVEEHVQLRESDPIPMPENSLLVYLRA